MTGFKPKTKRLNVENEAEYANNLNAFYGRFDRTDVSTEQKQMADIVRSFPFEDIEISISEVRKLFSKLNSHKAKGPDGVSCKVLKLCANQLAFPFQKLFQTSISTGKVPALWKLATIVPVPKQPHPKQMNDLRPIALTSVPMKCLERVVMKRLLPSVNESLDQMQFAYRPKWSVEDAVLTLLHGVYEHLEKAGSFAKILFVDFSSAFNTIQPHVMIKKLLDLEVNPKLIIWINSFLTNRKQNVKLNATVSPILSINTGAPQGCVLSPVLFTMYANDCVT